MATGPWETSHNGEYSMALERIKCCLMRSNAYWCSVVRCFPGAGSHFRALPSHNEGAKMAAISCPTGPKWPLEQPKGAGAQRFRALGKQGEHAKTLLCHLNKAGMG